MNQEIISEEEFKVRQKIKEASSGYKIDFEELSALKIEINYIKKKVGQSRHRLIKGNVGHHEIQLIKSDY